MMSNPLDKRAENRGTNRAHPLKVMNRWLFSRIALGAVGLVLLYYNVAWAVLRCPHQENQSQEITAYEPDSWHRHANLDCTGPKYHTEVLAGPSNSEVLRLAGVIASQGNLFVGFADPALKQIEDFSPLPLFDDRSSTGLPFGLPRYISLSVFRF